MKFLVEAIEDMEVITEESNGKKSLFIVGPALVAEEKNKNGRVYPKGILSNEVNRYITENFPNRAVGELGHPEGPNMNPERISHKFISLKEDGNRWIAKAKIIESNPTGAIAAGLLREGIELGFSSRGLGSLKTNSQGIQEVQSDFRLATPADIVMNPSAPGCFVQGIMENSEWYFDVSKGTWMEKKFDQLVETMKKMPVKELLEKKADLFAFYLKNISESK